MNDNIFYSDLIGQFGSIAAHSKRIWIAIHVEREPEGRTRNYIIDYSRCVAGTTHGDDALYADYRQIIHPPSHHGLPLLGPSACPVTAPDRITWSLEPI